MSDLSDRALFAEAMELRPLELPGRYRGRLDERWTIGPKVHGGAMLALCAKAARTALAAQAHIQPIAVSASYLSAPDPGPMLVSAVVRKRGRRVSLVDVELSAEADPERVAVRVVVTLGDPEHHVPPLMVVNPVPALMPPEPPPGVEPIGPGHPMADVVHLAHGCDLRPSLTSLRPRADGGPPVFEYWVRPRGMPADVLFALLCGDVSAPVTFAMGRYGWAPTVQLTAYLRGLPADGWLRVMVTSMQIGQGWFDEDHLVVDAEGRIIVQSRQLAVVPEAPEG